MGKRRGGRATEESGVVRSMGKSRALQKMENSGNEAKKYLKTKKVGIFTGAFFVRFERILRAI